jgi:CheY-like chemotaxis protein
MVLQEGRELHVLAVDDSPVDRALIAMLLRSSKFRGTIRFFDGQLLKFVVN